MFTSFRKSLLAVATLATIVTAGAVAPASAQGWGGGWEHRRDHRWEERRDHRWEDRGDWGGRRWGGWDRPRWHRQHCWVEVRPMRVFTPWGPRIRNVEQRVCR